MKQVELEKIAQGAEASIYKINEGILKKRPVKNYRHPDIDARLRKSRTRKEAKVLTQLKNLHVRGPELISVDDKEGNIVMSEVKGDKLRDKLDAKPTLMSKVGEPIAKMHDANLVHGDLTTSNMILTKEGQVALIDFGLTQSTTKIEDKAVDLHLLKQALMSKHHTIADSAWASFLESYQPKKRDEILARLEVVEMRGRNKHE